MGSLKPLALVALLISAFAVVSESRVARKDLGLDLGGIGIGAGIGIGLGLGLGGGSGAGSGSGSGSG
jgi:hypothetical protein